MTTFDRLAAATHLVNVKSASASDKLLAAGATLVNNQPHGLMQNLTGLFGGDDRGSQITQKLQQMGAGALR